MNEFIILIVLLIIGVAILLWGLGIWSRPGRVVNRPGTFLISIGSMTLIITLYFSLIWFPEYASAITASSTLLLVLSILLLIIVFINSNNQRIVREDRLRKEDIDRETKTFSIRQQSDDQLRSEQRQRDDQLRSEQRQRDDQLRSEQRQRDDQFRSEQKEKDFRTLCLNEIQNWLQEGIEILSQTNFATSDMQEQLRRRIEHLNSKTLWISKASTPFNNNNLKSHIDESIKQIKSICVEDFNPIIPDKIKKCVDSLNTSLEQVINTRITIEL